jgi:hypothetical protein
MWMRVAEATKGTTVVGLVLVFLTGCGDDATEPAIGVADVGVTTIGEDPDPDGYILSVDGGPAQSVGVSDAITLSGLRTGGHVVLLGGIAPNCSVIGKNPTSVHISSTTPAQVAFPVRCWAFDVLQVLSLSTYDGSGQVVHPDMARTPTFQHSSLWLAITPYPSGNASFENPSVFQSDDPLAWSVPVGLTNPIAKPSSGYFSDPDIVLSEDRKELWVYFREVTGIQNIIRLANSADGVHWSSPTQVIAVPSHELVSPAVVRGAPHAPWQMWSVNSGPKGCRAPATSVERRTSQDGRLWSGPQPVDLQQPGFNVWHIEVQWLPSRGEYWALYNVYAPGSNCVTPALYLATSSDGISWTTFPSPVLSHGVIDEFGDVVYRSTFDYDADFGAVTFWFSGSKYNGTAYTWRMAAQIRRVPDLFRQIELPQPAAVAPLGPVGRQLPPPEPADTGPSR